MRLHAFQGVRYGDRAGDPGALAAPPYDQINDRQRDRLHQTAHHFSHLSRPVRNGAEDEHAHAAALHEAWLTEGILVEESRPALYLYEIRLPDGGRRLGLTALVDLESPERRVIRPHEQTLEKAVADRLRLLRAMQVDLEPILLLADDDGVLDSLVAADLDGSPPLVRHTDPSGCVHAIHRVEDDDRIRTYSEAARGRPGLIADGHHRYKVAGLYAAESHARRGTAAGTKLAVVTSLASPELAIDPIHRGFESTLDLAVVRTEATEILPLETELGPAFAAAVAAAEQPAIGVWQDDRGEIWRFAPERLAELAPGRRGLAVAILHDLLLPRLGVPAAAATDGTITYRSDPAEMAEEVAGGALKTAFLLPPMDPAEFAAAVADGGLLPPKSTRFLPKVVSGLVWARHASRLLP